MGMGHGGARVGAGRKPKRRRNTVPFTPIDGGRAGDVPQKPPADLPADQWDFWATYAPLAIEQGTLTTATVGAFRLLCEVDAEKRATREQIEKDGRTFVKVTRDFEGNELREFKAHPLTGSYRQLAQRVEALMGRFKLAPFGKAVDGAGNGRGRGATPINPWAKIAAAKK